MSDSNPEPGHGDCQVTLATPVGRSAVATVMVNGNDPVAPVGKLFKAASGRPLETVPVDRIVFGQWQTDEGAAEELVVCRRSERLVEIHCHGGAAAPEAIIGSLAELGCRRVGWQAWLQAAGHDPISVEARIALSASRTTRTAQILLHQFNGALRQAVDDAVRHLKADDLRAASQIIERLLLLTSVGLHLADPWQVVLAGAPNVGKSSLINAILGYQRAIVYDQPGTTRDVVAATTAIDGWPMELADTAGLRVAQGPIEEEGVSLARDRAARADLLLLVFDATAPWSSDDQEMLSQHPHALVIHNKCDLAPRGLDRPPGLLTSATRGDAIGRLLEEITARLVPSIPNAGEAVPFTERQVALLSRALQLSVDDRNSAIMLLEEI